MERKYLPIDLLRRMPSSYYVIRYHMLCTTKYDWFVRPDNETCYYINGERPIVEGEVYNCNWTPEKWNTDPYIYINRNGNEYIKYAREGLESLDKYHYGWKREDSLILKNGEPIYYGLPRTMKTDWSAHWFIDREKICITTGNHATEYNGLHDIHRQGNFVINGGVIEIKKPITEPVLSIAKKLNSRKYKGFYDPFIDKLIEVYKLNRMQI